MGGLEAVLTGLTDILPVKRYRYGRELLTACVVCAAFCVALPNVTCVSMLVASARNVRNATREKYANKYSTNEHSDNSVYGVQWTPKQKKIFINL